MGKKVLLVIAEGSETVETVVQADILRHCGVAKFQCDSKTILLIFDLQNR
jgi:putative intracellular protease/amidase